MRWRERGAALWRDILASFVDLDRHLVQRYEWFTARSVKRVVDRVTVWHQLAQLLLGAVIVWMLNQLPTDATWTLVVHIGDAVWAIVAVVNVWQLLHGLAHDGKNGRWRWRRGDEPPNMPTPPDDRDRLPLPVGGQRGSEGG